MKKRKLNISRVITFLSTLVLINVLLIFGIFFYKLSPLEKDEKIENYKVELGKTGYEVFDDLEKKGFIRSSLFLKIYSKFSSIKKIDAGNFEISKSYSAPKIYKILKKDNILQKEEESFTFKEGQKIEDLANIIDEKTSIEKDDFLNMLNNKDYLKTLIDTYWFLTDDILNESIFYPLEGYLYPDTYKIKADSTIKEIIEKMLEETNNKLSLYKNDMLKNDLTIHEIISLASIVEMEGAKEEDRRSIAGVFMNRIQNEWNLGSDVTVYYGLKLNMSERDLYQREIDDCSNLYNTRCNKGLPVGPISNPSIESIKACIYIEDNEYYYFVSDKYKNIYFSKTFDEHSTTISKLKSEGLWYEYD